MAESAVLPQGGLPPPQGGGPAMGGDVAFEYDEHVRQNNSRLVSLSEQLGDAATFASACQELTSWCSDPRAFTASFEGNLLAALQVAVSVSTRDGFDLELASAFVNACFGHRRTLSKDGQTKIARWYEQLRRRRQTRLKRLKKEKEKEEAAAQAQSGPGGEQQQPESAMWTGQPGPFIHMARPAVGFPDGTGYGMEHGMARVPMQVMQPGGHFDPSWMARAGTAGSMPMAAMHPQQQQQMMLAARSRQMAAASAGAASPGQPMMTPNGHPAMSPVYPGGHPNAAQMIRAGPPLLYSEMHGSMSQQQVIMYPNPSMPPQVMPMGPPDGNTPINILREELLKPFGLEHNRASTDVPLQISDQMFQQLHSPPYLDVALRSFDVQDHACRCQWSISAAQHAYNVQVLVNGQEVMPSNPVSSLLIKQFLRPGQNIITLNIRDCICRFKFSVSAVQRVPLRQVVTDLVNQQRGNLEASRLKLRQLLPTPTPMRLRLRDVSGAHLRVPGRSARCRHVECFDIEVLLATSRDGNAFVCPLCRLLFTMAEIEPDFVVAEILRKTYGSTICEVWVDGNGSWQPIDPATANVVPLGAQPNGQNPVDAKPASNGRKRAEPGDSSVGSMAMKRVKSEPAPLMPESDGVAAPPSVPLPALKSEVFSPVPANSNMMSPFSNPSMHASPQKPMHSMTPGHAKVASPAMAAAPGTPQGAGACVVPSPRPPTANSMSATSVCASGTGHLGGHAEAASVAGSAPYTPSSVGSTLSQGAAPWSASSSTEPQNASLDIDVDSLVNTQIDDLHKYIDAGLADFDDLRLQDGSTPPSFTDTLWSDVASIIHADGR